MRVVGQGDRRSHLSGRRGVRGRARVSPRPVRRPVVVPERPAAAPRATPTGPQLLSIKSRPQLSEEASEPAGPHLTGDESQICRLGVCLLITNVPLSRPRLTVRTPCCTHNAAGTPERRRQCAGPARRAREAARRLRGRVACMLRCQGNPPTLICPSPAGPDPPRRPATNGPSVRVEVSGFVRTERLSGPRAALRAKSERLGLAEAVSRRERARAPRGFRTDLPGSRPRAA